jgi:hypothetical protein
MPQEVEKNVAQTMSFYASAFRDIAEGKYTLKQTENYGKWLSIQQTFAHAATVQGQAALMQGRAALTNAALKMTVTKAEGKNSGKTITSLPSAVTYSKTFSVGSVLIIASKDAAADTSLADGGKTLVAKIKLTPVANSNTDANGVALKTLAKTLKLTTTTASNITGTTAYELKRVSSLGGTNSVTGSVNGDIVTFNISAIGNNNNELTSNGTVYEVWATATVKDANKNAYLEMSLDTTAGNVVANDGTTDVASIISETVRFGQSVYIK